VGAVNAFLKAWSLNKGNARFALYAGYALWQAGRNEEALQVWSIGSDMDPLVRIAHLRPDADQTTRIKSETADNELRRFFTQMYQNGLARYENPERLLSAMWPQTHIGNVEYKRENQKPYMFYAPDLPETPVFETSEIPWAQTLKNATPKIIQELETYLENTHDYGRPYLAHMSDGEESWEHLRGSEDWNALHLYKDAEKQSCASSFPETLTTLEDAPLVEMFGTPMEVFFSVLKPNTHIPPHFGLSNSRLTAHLPLIIPRDCKIRVADQTHHWRRGELFLFDDSFDHEARNDSDEVRVVLIFETWRPDLSADEVRALQHSMEVRSRWLQSRKIPVIENIELV
ncbi:MAG: aspartyl/asparaginyl beta-hydroxylase domain-containing protein, partial [Acidimicrobiales bacterium]